MAQLHFRVPIVSPTGSSSSPFNIKGSGECVLPDA